MSQNLPRSPLGPMKDRAIKWMLNNPKCSMHQIREGAFTDLTAKYVSNLLWELKRDGLVTAERSINTEMPTEWSVNINNLVKLINIGHFLKTGTIIGLAHETTNKEN